MAEQQQHFEKPTPIPVLPGLARLAFGGSLVSGGCGSVVVGVGLLVVSGAVTVLVFAVLVIAGIAGSLWNYATRDRPPE